MSDSACDTSCERVGGAWLASSAGRLRCDWLMPVGTKYGHSTEQRTCSLTRPRSWYSVSDSDTTACLDTLYTPIAGGFSKPAIDAVLTIWPWYDGSFSAAASISGVKMRTPWITP
ncbi:hypothetical protein D3C81_1150560 [compost metagenome]